jgi:hypothetical protein
MHNEQGSRVSSMQSGSNGMCKPSHGALQDAPQVSANSQELHIAELVVSPSLSIRLSTIGGLSSTEIEVQCKGDGSVASDGGINIGGDAYHRRPYKKVNIGGDDDVGVLAVQMDVCREIEGDLHSLSVEHPADDLARRHRRSSSPRCEALQGACPPCPF